MRTARVHFHALQFFGRARGKARSHDIILFRYQVRVPPEAAFILVFVPSFRGVYTCMCSVRAFDTIVVMEKIIPTLHIFTGAGVAKSHTEATFDQNILHIVSLPKTHISK